MKTFEAYVRIQSSGYIVKTVVQAENSQAAYFLLQGQYGQNNVVHLPREVWVKLWGATLAPHSRD